MLLVTCKSREEDMVLKFFLSFFDDLVEACEYSVADPFQVLSLLNAKEGQGVLSESCKDSLIAEGLVAHALEVGVLL